MTYKKTTIKGIIKDIDQNKIYLPALQRKFVWDKQRIQLLFDSLMRNYPFGTFLFWQLPRQKADTYVFYEFLKEYDERTPYNHRKTGAFLHEEITGVLDGQQRLSSMYIGLMGTHTERLKYAWAYKASSYEKTRLYLNLLSLPYILDAENQIITNEEQNFEFRFLTEQWVKTNQTRKVDGQPPKIEPMFWMEVGQVLKWGNDPEFDQVFDQIHSQCRDAAQKEAFSQKKRFIKRGLDILHTRIHRDELINYFEITKDDLEDILKIFVRVNSGGTPLSKLDLLFSTIVATWDDGREKIEELLRKINAKGFGFGHEYLMRCCLVLSDAPAVYKVNSFKAENVEKIRVEWPQIAAAIEKTVDLLREFGFDGSALLSQNATILIAYYLYKGGDTSEKSKADMRKYLIHTLLKGIYSSSQDQMLTVLRNAFREEIKSETGQVSYRGHYKSFSFDEILKISLPQQKSLKVTADDVERFLQYKKGSGSFLVLALLYPQLRYNQVWFHQDHIHPYAGFAKDKARQFGLTDEQWQEWLDWRDCVPNLQLMEGRENERKKATPIKDWLEKEYPGIREREKFTIDNYLPDDIGLEFEHFKSFFKSRKEKLRQELYKVLAITTTPVFDEIDWSDRDDEIEAPETPITVETSA